MTISPQGNERRAFTLIVALAFVVGSFLRLYLLPGQVLVDDEWHSMSFVVGKSLSWVLVNFTVPSGFTSIPLNIYQWALLHSVGWSETLLRLPSISLGLLSLIVAPLLAKSVFGSKRAACFALLMAISPLLIFYTRLSRPYSAVAFFSVLAFLCAALWMRSGKRRHGIGFGVCGVLAVYCHPFAAISIATIGGSILMGSFARSMWAVSKQVSGPSRQQAVCVLLAMGALGSILLLPALINSMQTSFFDVAQQGSIFLSSWWRLASLMSGTSNTLLIFVFWLLACVGLVHIGRRDPWLAITVFALYPMQMMALWLTRPHSCHVGIVLARYSMPLVPVTLCLVACGWQSLVDRLSQHLKIAGALTFVFVAALAVAGPLRGTYAQASQFTNHGVFQHDYGSVDWGHSFISDFTPPDYPFTTSIQSQELSRFYARLREKESNRPVVEYPMMVGDHFNPVYYYQWHHRRPILVGYIRGSDAKRELYAGGVYGDTYIDEVLNLVEDRSRLRFRNLVDMHNIESMRERGVEYIIVHKQFEAELWKAAPPPRGIQKLLRQYRNELHAVHEDSRISVFGLDR